MCFGCVLEEIPTDAAGALLWPPLTDAMRACASECGAFYDLPGCSVGGPLHITLDDYNAMLRKQAPRCAICRRPETSKYKNGRIKRLAVDHDHVTKAVRALLCQRCNLLVWALEDNHIAIASIRAYVEEWRESFANGGADLLA